MSPIPFVTLDDPQYGESIAVSPSIRRIIANNPSKFTYHGTGTYVVGADAGDDAGRGDVAVIDPGPQLDSHRDSLIAALRGRRVTAILVTHCHADHSPMAAWLKAETGAPTVGFGPHPRLDDPDADDPITSTDEQPYELPDGQPDGQHGGADEPAVVEESTDYDFDPDIRVADGQVAAEGAGWVLRAVHTPGHTSNHLCFAFDHERALFTGDHIMGWSTTVIGPPDGDMRAYFDSLRKVQGRDDRVFWPTHGAPVTDTRPFLDAFVAHRLEREAQVLAAVRSGQSSIAAMVEVLYADVRKELHKPAARSVLAHLVKLVHDGLVTVDGVPRLRATYHPT
jgi:glyoxylase-like metal-dependent hydrolase (beta-lactamase superfamily II)